MATFRVGVGSFNIQDGAVGFGTDTDSLGNLRVKGVTKTTGSIVSGASTLTRYSGFAADNINQLENITLTSEVGTIGDIVVGVGTSVIISTASTVTVGTVESVSIGTHFSLPTGGIEERGEDFIEGMMRFNTDINTMEFYNGNEWRQFTYVADIQNSPSTGNLGLFVGGAVANGDTSKQIESINISSRGNAVDFGEMTDIRTSLGACANKIRGVFMGGSEPGNFKNVIDYVTMSSKSDAQDFGDLIIKSNGVSSLCSSTRGFRIGGANSDGTNAPNTIEYVQINTLGNALDFGDLTTNRNGQPGSASSPVRGIVCGSYTGTPGVYTSAIDSFTMASLGNATKFGDCINESGQQGTVSNSVRAVLHTGRQASGTGQISFITIASEGNATEFGSLDPDIHDVSGNSMFTQGCSNHTRAVWLNGNASGNLFGGNKGRTVSIEIATGGRAENFGDAPKKWRRFASCSNAHGGLGGY